MELTANYSRISYLTLEDYFRRGGFRGGELRSRLAGWSNPSLLEGGRIGSKDFDGLKGLAYSPLFDRGSRIATACLI